MPDQNLKKKKQNCTELEFMELEFHKFLFIYLFIPILDFLQIEFYIETGF